MTGVNEAALCEHISGRLAEMGFHVLPDGQTARGRVDLVATAGDPPQEFAIELALGSARAACHLVTRQAVEVNQGGARQQVLGLSHVTPADGEFLRRHEVNYVDSGGNAWIEAPGVKIWVEGRRPELVARADADRPSRAFRPVGLRVVFILLVSPDLLQSSMREIAGAAGVSLGAVSNTMTDLKDASLLGEVRRRRVLPDPRRLMQRWIEHYISGLRPDLEERRVAGPEPTWWASQEGTDLMAAHDCQLGGEVALNWMKTGLRPGETLLYGEPPWKGLVRELRMPPSADGNVILRQRFWNADELRMHRAAPPLLVYADAIASGDARQIEMAKEMASEQSVLEPRT